MWVAHALTLSRIPLGFAVAAFYADRALVVTLIAIAALTDAIDGRVARAMQRRGRRTPDIGGWLDPLADKIFVVTVLAAMWIHTHALAVIALLAAREVLLVPLVVIHLVRHRARRLSAEPIGKAATVVQLIAMVVAIAVPAAALPAAAIAGALGVIAVGYYVGRERADDARTE